MIKKSPYSALINERGYGIGAFSSGLIFKINTMAIRFNPM